MDFILAAAAEQTGNGANLQIWSALIAAIFGGAGLKLVEALLNRGKDRLDAATAIREELRTEIQNLKAEIKSVETDVDKWREKYYSLLERYNEVRTLLAQRGIDLKEADGETSK